MKTLILVIVLVTELSWTRKGIILPQKQINVSHSNSATPQYPPVHVRCTHVSMPIMMTLSVEFRASVPTVGGIHLVPFKEVGIQNTTSIVMEHNSYWLIPTLDESSTSPMTIMCGVVGVANNCCSYSPLESPWLPSHCTTTVTVTEAFPNWASMLYQMTLMYGMHQLSAIHR